jgi:hypothetical protein
MRALEGDTWRGDSALTFTRASNGRLLAVVDGRVFAFADDNDHVVEQAPARGGRG